VRSVEESCRCEMKAEGKTLVVIEQRIQLLRGFLDALENGKVDSGEPYHSFINRHIVAAKNAVVEAGTLKRMTIGPPPAVGGIVAQNIDPFDNIFTDFWGMSMLPAVIDCVEQAIGVYEYMKTEDGLALVRSREAIDIESAIERALRPAFRNGPPKSERAVQDAVENILNVLGVEFSRDREVAMVAAKAFRPDFVVTAMQLAIEVKLANQAHDGAQIQEELAADISAYMTKWRRLMVVVYDLGVIADPYRFRTDNQKLFGVSVTVVKH